MVICDHLMTMKEVRIAELKSRLSEYLREVRAGHTIIVMDRDSPIATLVPYASAAETLVVRRPRRRWPSLQEVPLPVPASGATDIVDLLLEERRSDR
jgi:prevent-host-death family protein